jgi:hypothetical protein
MCGLRVNPAQPCLVGVETQQSGGGQAVGADACQTLVFGRRRGGLEGNHGCRRCNVETSLLASTGNSPGGGRSALEHVVLVFEVCVYPGRGNGVDGMTGETRVSM